jgi:hypothetical protein
MGLEISSCFGDKMVLVGWLFLQRQQKNTLRIAMEIVVSIVS